MRIVFMTYSPSIKATTLLPSRGSRDLSITAMSPLWMPVSYMELPSTRAKKVLAGFLIRILFRFMDCST